jgi:predicted transcriptional regulator
LAQEALEAYVDVNEWHTAAIERGLADARAGRVVEHERVRRWLESWGADDELDSP